MKKRLFALISMAVCSFGLTACGNGEDLGEAMGRAGLNTLIGMGTVFIVLILISLIIQGFAVIPKLQKAFAKNKDGGQAVRQEPAVQVQQPEPEEADETDDLELVAVIAAAIAASEGAATTDGFVVRSIIRRA